MWKTRLCLATYCNGIPLKEQMVLIKNTGFDGFFLSWNAKVDLKPIRAFADELGLYFQSVHAPFGGATVMWKEGEEGEKAVAELLQCVDDTAGAGVEILVCHAVIGFELSKPTAVGIENYRKVVERAKARGVKIAFENTENEVFLSALMEAFKDYDNVGFCLDTGHEICYNHGEDMLALYGDRLIATHLNDNLGIRDFNGSITYLDDLHLLPFDGICDWQGVAERLHACGFDGPLTFELNLNSKPGRHENDAYAEMPFERYLAEAFARACRVARLLQKVKKQ